MIDVLGLLAVVAVIIAAGGVMGVGFQAYALRGARRAAPLISAAALYAVAFLSQPPAPLAHMWQASTLSTAEALRWVAFGLFALFMLREYRRLIRHCHDQAQRIRELERSRGV